MPTILTPEEKARVEIDRQLEACGWQVQSREQQNLFAQRGVAVAEFPLKTGYADYLLCVDGKAIGAVVEGVEASLNANLHRAERLRQSILKQAFEGRLVPQDPADEPASVLLVRIRAAKDGGKSRQLGLPGV